jgi:hypothetical protein
MRLIELYFDRLPRSISLARGRVTAVILHPNACLKRYGGYRRRNSARTLDKNSAFAFKCFIINYLARHP